MKDEPAKLRIVLERRVVHFGAFEADLSTGELRKRGVKVKLQYQPFQLLCMLLESPGNLLTRDEIRLRLWGKDTFVDFENGLNTAISRIREALGDTAEKPRFIETVPRRGYRFIAAIENGRTPDRRLSEQNQIAENARRQPFEAASDSAAVTAVPIPAQLEEPPWRSEGLAGRNRGWIVVVASTAGLVFVLLAVRWNRPGPTPRFLNFERLTNDGRRKDLTFGLLTDGPRVYFVEFVDGRRVVAAVSIAGGDPEMTSFPPTISDVSADGKELLGSAFASPGDNDRSLAIWPVTGGSPHSIGGLKGEQPVWSPLGDRVAYLKGQSLFVADKDGVNPRLVATVPGFRGGGLRWSPDGKVLRVAVQEARTEAVSLWDVSVDGIRLSKALSEGNVPTGLCGNWTKDGRYFVFPFGRDGRTDVLAVREAPEILRKDRAKPSPITAGPISYYSPLPSRDGRKLFVMGEDRRTELQRYNLESRRFAPFLAGISATDVDFSKDGNWMAYVKLPELTLWRSKVDGSDRHQLTSTSMEAWQPHWSPNQSQIAFMGRLPDRRFRICMISANGGPIQQLIPGDGEEGGPTWSPDGNQITFGEPLYRHDSSAMSIHILDLKTAQISTVPGSNGLWSARWSPGGRYISAIHLTGPSSSMSDEIRLYDFATHQWRVLTRIEPIAETTWSRNSEYLYFSTSGEESALYRVRVSDAKLESLMSLRDVAHDDGSWIGVTPDGSPLITTIKSLQEIYALDMEWP